MNTRSRWHGDWNGKHVLVTGGAGFIGSHVVDVMLRARRSRDGVRQLLDRVPRVSPAASRAACASSRGSSSTRPQIDDAMRGVDFVFHLAANADIKDNLASPRRCIDQNVIATQNVLEAMRASGVREIALSSTGLRLRRADRDAHARGRALPGPDVALRDVEDRRRGAAHVVRARLRLPHLDLPLRVASWARATRTGTSWTSGAS